MISFACQYRVFLLVLGLVVGSASIIACTDNSDFLRASGIVASPRVDAHALVTGDDTQVILLTHDFGRVRPGASLEHRFILQNNTQSRWTLSDVQRQCMCTVIVPATTSIAPGTAEPISVKYTPSSGSYDDRRRATLWFSEAGAPIVHLEIQAHVREPLTVSPVMLRLPYVGTGTTASHELSFCNYGDEDWTRITVKTSDKWLAPSEPLVVRSNEVSVSGPRQSWQSVVRIDTTALVPGRHRGFLQIEAHASSVISTSLPVDIYVQAPVAAIPAQLFFAEVAPGAAITRKLLVRIPPDAKVTPEAIALRHDLGPALDAVCSPLAGQYFQVTACLRAPSTDGPLHGALEIAFTDPSLPPLVVPVHALVNSRDETH